MSARDVQGALNVDRRTWDRTEYEARAKERVARDDGEEEVAPGSVRNKEEFRKADAGKAGPAGSERAFLRAREGDLQLESMAGRTTIVAPNAAANRQGGWFCDVCQCQLRDSVSYVDHINGKKHQRKLGYSMRTERSSLGDVQARLAAHKRKREEDAARQAKRRNKTQAEAELDQIEEYEEKLEEEERERQRRREERKRRKQEEKAQELEKEKETEADDEERDASGMDPAMMAMMGFGGFGSSKK